MYTVIYIYLGYYDCTKTAGTGESSTVETSRTQREPEELLLLLLRLIKPP